MNYCGYINCYKIHKKKILNANIFVKNFKNLSAQLWSVINYLSYETPLISNVINGRTCLIWSTNLSVGERRFNVKCKVHEKYLLLSSIAMNAREFLSSNFANNDQSLYTSFLVTWSQWIFAVVSLITSCGVSCSYAHVSTLLQYYAFVNYFEIWVEHVKCGKINYIFEYYYKGSDHLHRALSL